MSEPRFTTKQIERLQREANTACTYGVQPRLILLLGIYTRAYKAGRRAEQRKRRAGR